MYIQITDDYEANDKKGIYVTLTIMGETQNDDEDDLILFRIENDEIILYESQNGEFICKACGDTFTKENLNLICQWLTDKNGDVDIEIDLDWVDLYWDWRKREIFDKERIEVTDIKTLDVKTLEFARQLAWGFEFTCKKTKEGRTLAHAYSQMQQVLTHYISKVKEEN